MLLFKSGQHRDARFLRYALIYIRDDSGDLVKTLKENNFEYTWGNVTVKLANSFGFCWGVERAVQIAYEARKQFPDQKLWITNEIIHNPTVNKVGGLLFCFGMFAIA